VAALDTVHAEWHCGPPELIESQRQLNALHVALGCRPTLTCAPYQSHPRPRFGEHVAWAESNAIVFVNSVLGARTDRYGDFTDLAAALTGRVPFAGLHRDENRLARALIGVVDLGKSGLPRDLYFAAVGFVLGRVSAGQVPLLEGLPADASEDELKSLGAAAASSGGLGLFHALEVTPEAPTLATASGGRTIPRGADLSSDDLARAVATLCPLQVGEPVAAMCLGTPHFSRGEFAELARSVCGRRAAPAVRVYVSTSRAIAAQLEASEDRALLEHFGVRVVVDTCTYVTPGLTMSAGAIVTNSAKYAHYGPGNLRRRVGLMTLERCIRSAECGTVAAP